MNSSIKSTVYLAIINQTDGHQEENRRANSSPSSVLQFSFGASCWESLKWTILRKQKTWLGESWRHHHTGESERGGGVELSYNTWPKDFHKGKESSVVRAHGHHLGVVRVPLCSSDLWVVLPIDAAWAVAPRKGMGGLLVWVMAACMPPEMRLFGLCFSPVDNSGALAPRALLPSEYTCPHFALACVSLVLGAGHFPKPSLLRCLPWGKDFCESLRSLTCQFFMCLICQALSSYPVMFYTGKDETRFRVPPCM